MAQRPASRQNWRWWVAGLLLAVLAGALGAWGGAQWSPAAPRLTQEDIDAAVLHTLHTQNLPSKSARAAAVITAAARALFEGRFCVCKVCNTAASMSSWVKRGAAGDHWAPPQAPSAPANTASNKPATHQRQFWREAGRWAMTCPSPRGSCEATTGGSGCRDGLGRWTGARLITANITQPVMLECHEPVKPEISGFTGS